VITETPAGRSAGRPKADISASGRKQGVFGRLDSTFNDAVKTVAVRK
jgi:hypothetical protein